jgi:hypothetical protein
MIAAIGALVHGLVAMGQRPDHQAPLAVGVATAGVVDPDEGLIRSAVDTIRGWLASRSADGSRKSPGFLLPWKMTSTPWA